MLCASRAGAIAKKLDGRAPTNEIRHAFIKRAGSFDVQRVVKQLVKDDFRQGDFVVAQQVGEQRVIEPSKRTEGGGRSYIGIVAIVFELFRLQPPRLPWKSILCKEPDLRSGTTTCRAAVQSAAQR